MQSDGCRLNSSSAPSLGASTLAVGASTLAGLLDEVDNHAAFWVVDSKGGKKPPAGRPPWARQKPPATVAPSAASLPTTLLHKSTGRLSPPRQRPPSRVSAAATKRPDVSLHVINPVAVEEAQARRKQPLAPLTAPARRPATPKSTLSRSASEPHARPFTPSVSAPAFAQSATTDSLPAAPLQPSASALAALLQQKRQALHRPHEQSGLARVGWHGSRDATALAERRAAAKVERVGLLGGVGDSPRGAAGDVVLGGGAGALGDALVAPRQSREAEAWLGRMLGRGLAETMAPAEEAALLRRMGADRDLIEEMEDIDMGILGLDSDEEDEPSFGIATGAAPFGRATPADAGRRSSTPAAGSRAAAAARAAKPLSATEKTRRQLMRAAGGLQAAGLDRASLAALGLGTDSQASQLYNLLFVYSFGVRDNLQRLAAGATAAGRGEFTVRAWRTLVGISETLVRADLGSAMASTVSSLEEALAQAEATSAHAAVDEAEARHALQRKVDEALFERDSSFVAAEERALELREAAALLGEARAEAAALRRELAEARRATDEASRLAESRRVGIAATNAALGQAKAGAAAARRTMAAADELVAPRAELERVRDEVVAERAACGALEARLAEEAAAHATCRAALGEATRRLEAGGAVSAADAAAQAHGAAARARDESAVQMARCECEAGLLAGELRIHEAGWVSAARLARAASSAARSSEAVVVPALRVRVGELEAELARLRAGGGEEQAAVMAQ